MKTRHAGIPDRCAPVLFFALCGLILGSSALCAQGGRRNPVSKVYFTDVNGEALINTGEKISDVAKRSVHIAEGSVIETRSTSDPRTTGRAYSTMVYSNGTGAYFDADTRVEVRRFQQEPFIPQRTDMDVEPSISQTQAFVARGSIGLCTSKLVAGSTMVYQTPHASVNVRARRVVIETDAETTKISVLEGESIVRAGPEDMGGHTVGPGEQAVIRRGGMGQPNVIRIVPIPPSERPQIEDRVAMACMAKRTVYFEERSAGAGEQGGEDADMGVVTAFDGTSGGEAGGPTSEIVPVEVVPETLPVEFTISPAQILSAPPTPSGG